MPYISSSSIIRLTSKSSKPVSFITPVYHFEINIFLLEFKLNKKKVDGKDWKTSPREFVGAVESEKNKNAVDRCGFSNLLFAEVITLLNSRDLNHDFNCSVFLSIGVIQSFSSFLVQVEFFIVG